MNSLCISLEQSCWFSIDYWDYLRLYLRLFLGSNQCVSNIVEMMVLPPSKHACYIVLSILWWETGRENGLRTTYVPTPGRFFYFEWKPNPMPGLGRLCKPITGGGGGGGGILIHSLKRATPPPPSTQTYTYVNTHPCSRPLYFVPWKYSQYKKGKGWREVCQITSNYYWLQVLQSMKFYRLNHGSKPAMKVKHTNTYEIQTCMVAFHILLYRSAYKIIWKTYIS